VTILGALAAVTALGAMAVAPVQARARRQVRARLSPPPDDGQPVRRPAPAVLVLAVAGLLTAWLVAGPVLAALLGGMGAAAPAAARVRRRAVERQARDRQMPAALDRLATALRSGASLPQALADVGAALGPPLGAEISALARASDHGRPLHGVLDEWSAAHGDPGTRLTATALVLATVVGSAPAHAVDGVASTLRERLDLAAERRALAVQARTSALVLSVAPVGFAGLLIAADTAAAGFLLGTPAGWGCLAAGAALDASGAWWMTRLSRSDVW
jgi:tight adherence protein B